VDEATHTLNGSAGTSYYTLSAVPTADVTVTATMTGPNVSESGSMTVTGQNPSVLLTSTLYISNAEYCITATHSYPGGGCSSNACLTTPDVPRVTNVEYERILTDDLAIDANPNKSAGWRIFPDKKIPAESADRRRIRVKAQYYQPTAGVRIYFRNFDADDPSADAAPIDTNDTFSVKAGNDNRGNVDGTVATKAGVLIAPPTGEPNPYSCQPFSNTFASGVSCLTDAAGLTKVDFTVTMQPGDNFAVAAGADEDYISSLVPAADGINLKDANNIRTPAAINGANACAATSLQACRADMLTVWRRLHIEVDSMGNVTDNKATGTITGASSTTSGTRIVVNPAPDENYRFEPGTIFIDQVGTYAVKDNVENEVIIGALLSPSLLVGKSFVLVDDDDFENDDPTDNGDDMDDVSETSATFYKMQPSDSNKENVFAQVYIMPVYDGGGASENNNTGIQFIQNLSENLLIQQLNIGRNSGSAESDNFWISYVQIAYQPGTDTDRDPDTDRKLIPDDTDLGVTPDVEAIDVVLPNCSNVPRGAVGSFLFQEVIKDIFHLEGLTDKGFTAPHEIAHQFGILGDQNGLKIMSKELNPDPTFIPEHIHLIRCRVKSPGQS
jgi:hypothetical protein